MDGVLPRLKRNWDRFINLDSNSEVEKNYNLDAFLNLLCKDEMSSEIKMWCDVSNVGNVLSHNFLSEIHHICTVSASNTNAVEELATDEYEDLKPLRQYLILGRGWKILYVVNSIGVQHLSCCRELSNLLISLLPVCFKLADKPSEGNQIQSIQIKLEFNNIDSCFIPRSKSGTQKKFTQKGLRSAIRKSNPLKVVRQNSNSSDSDIENKRPLSVNKYLNHIELLMDSDSSSAAAKTAESECQRPLPIISSTNFCKLLLNLLQKICYRDMLRQNLTTSPPSFTILPFALETLCSLFFSSCELYAGDWNVKCVLELKCMILKLVFVSAAAVIGQPGGLDVFEKQHNTIGVLMRLAEHLFSTYSISAEADDKDTSKDLSFLFNILYGVIKLICHVTDWLSNRKYCGQVIRLLSSLTCVSENVWSGLWKAFTNENPIISTSELLKLVSHLELIISTIKRLKVIHIHNSRCLKRRHRKCHIDDVNHHHHNILGYPSKQAAENLMTPCCVSYLCNILLNILSNSSDLQVQKSVLTSLSNCGTCCCINLNITINKLLSMFVICSSAVQPSIVSVVEKILIIEKMSSSSNCSICINKLSSGIKNKISDDQSKGFDTVDSAIGLSEGSNPERPIVRHPGEHQSFEIYRDLLLLDDAHLQAMICNHLARLTVNGEDRVKRKIFNHVILPIFLAANSSSNQVKCQSVFKMCLSMMPELLQMPRNRNLFLNHGGIKHLKILIETSVHRPLALRILEIVIKYDLDENFDPENPKAQNCIVVEHKGYLIDKTTNFTTQIHNENIKKRSDELKTRKISLHHAVLCVFDDQDELIEACGEELSSFSKPEIEHTFNLFSEKSLDMQLINEKALFDELESLRDYWVSAKNLLSDSEAYRMFLCDPSSMKVVTSAIDLVEMLAAEFSKSSITSTFVSAGDYKAVQQVKLELFDALLLICLQLMTVENVKQLMTARHMMKKLKDHLIEFEPQNSADFKLILDVLLQCCLGQSLFSRKQNSNHFSSSISEKSPGINDENLNDDNKEKFVEYDADAEYSASHEFHDARRRVKPAKLNKIVFPESCRLMIDLMAHKLKKIVNDSETSDDDIEAYMCVYVQIFQKLHSYCSQSIQNVRLMYKQNILKKLLDGFDDILIINDKKFKEFQMTILATFSLIAKTYISSKELQKILDYFKVPTAPIDILVKTLRRLISGMRLQPTNLLSFPALLSANDQSIFECDSTLTSDSGVGISPIIDADGTIPSELHKKHRESTLPSAWAATSMVLPLPVDVIWHPKNKNFSFSLWMRVDGKHDDAKFKARDNQYCSFLDHENMQTGDRFYQPYHSWGENLHMLSIGSSQLLLEVWINPAQSNLVFRISVAVNDTYQVLCEEVSTSIFVFGLWHYLTVNITEKQEKRRIKAVVELNVDGLFEQSIQLNYIHVASAKTDVSSYILIGQSCSEDELRGFTGIWHLGSLMVFKDKVFTKESSLQMYALGPDLNSLTSCNLGNEMIFISPHISASVLKLGINWDILIGRDKFYPKLNVLQENLSLIFTAKKSSHFMLYPQPSNLASEVVGSLAQILPVINNLRYIGGNSFKASQQQPICARVIYLSSRNFNSYNGMDAAILSLGGISVFMFLFARIVECCKDKKSQADGLQVVLHLLDKNPVHAKSFFEINGYALLLRVLANERCKPNVQILKVLLDSCVSCSVLDHEQVSGRTIINEENEAIITNAELLAKMTIGWRAWDRGSGELMKIFMASISTLIRENHPYRKFNLRQLQSIYMLENVLLMYKVSSRIMYDRIEEKRCDKDKIVDDFEQTKVQESFFFDDHEKPRLSTGISKLVLKLIANFILMQPINTNYVMVLCDLLLLLHKDTATYVSTAHPGTYYIMSTYIVSQTLQNGESDPADQSSDVTKSTTVTTSPLMHTSSLGRPYKINILKRRSSNTTDNIKQRPNSAPAFAHDEVDAGSITKVSPTSVKNVERRNSVTPEKDDVLQVIELDPGPIESLPNGTACDEVDRKMEEAEDSLSSAIWYAPLIDSIESTSSHAKSSAIPVPIKERPASATTGSDSFVHIGSGDLAMASEDSNPISFTVSRKFRSASSATTPEIIASDGEDWDVTPEKAAEYSVLEVNDGFITIRVGLLKILKEIILVAPSELCNQLLGHVISIDFLLILCNHANPDVRTAVIMVLFAYTMQANENNLNCIIQMKAFHLLSNQLSNFAVTSSIMDALFSIVLKRKFCLEMPCDINDLTELKQIQIEAIVPILTLLPKTIDDLVLCHNVLSILKQVYTNTMPISWQFSDYGFNESLMQTLLRVLHSEQTHSDVAGQVEQDLILSDIKGIIAAIAENVMSNAAVVKFQVLSDLLHLLSHCERQEIGHCGISSKSVKVIRRCQIMCLQNSLDHIQHQLSSSNNKSASFFQSFSDRFLSRRSSFEKSVKDMFISVHNASPKALNVHQSKTDLSASTSDLHSSYSLTKRKVSNAAINFNDMAEKLDRLIQKSCDLIIHREMDSKFVMSEEEVFFSRGLFHLLIQGMASVMERTRGKKRNTWSSIMWSIRDTLRHRIGQLLVFLVSPLQSLEQRCYASSVLAEENKCKEIIKNVLSHNHELQRRVAIFMHDLLYGQQKDYLNSEQANNIEILVRVMEICGLNVIPTPPNTIDEWAMISEDRNNYMKYLQKDRAIAMQHKQVPEYRLRHKYDSILQAVSESADNVTQIAVLKKNSERKEFIESIRYVYMEQLESKKLWKNLRDQLSHERAVWYFKDLYPPSWQLDPTEGPHRVRKRLKRCYLNLKPKFFRPECQSKPDLTHVSPPLDYLLTDDDKVNDISSPMNRINSTEIISFTCMCTNVSLVSDIQGELLIAKSGMHFISDPKTECVKERFSMWETTNTPSMVFLYEEIREVLKRRYQLRDFAIELFLTNGKTFMLAFDSTEIRNMLYDNLMECDLPNLVMEIEPGSMQLTQMWREGLMTNFEYLTQLNKLAGRSFNDLMQYPTFPFVLSDYTSSALDLLDPSTFRVLGRPMPIQDKSKESYYIQAYAHIKNEIDSGHMDGPLVTASSAYHYSSLYSNSGNVLHFMVRMPPYTRLLVAYQDNNFDVADRSFHSMETCWRISSLQAGTDVKELISEFYYLPEFLLNSEGFDFGVRQSGERVDDVILPNWCRSNARLFILIHRQALESNYVSEHINEWIDLVFGYKQTGKPAYDAINVFHPVTYSGDNVFNIEDPIQRGALYTMIKTYGQMPKQVFQSRHPMVSMTFNKQESLQVPQVIPEVRGLKWGSYVGSPAEPEPVIVWRRNHQSTIGLFVPLSTNDVFGLSPMSCLIVSYSKEKGSTLFNTTYVTAAALVSWGHFDGLLRVKFRKDHQLLPIIKPCPLDPICLCASVPDCKLLFVCHQSGTIDIYTTFFDPIKPQLDLKMHDLKFIGHKSKVTAICICRSFSIVVTSSSDGTIIIWDLNRLKYVRYFDDHDGNSVQLVAVSDTSGDIASVSRNNNGSSLKLHTVNGAFVGAIVTSRKIHSICFSNAPEGVSVNVIAGGMDNGVIKLWSSWDLVLVTEIRAEKFSRPIACLVFSHDSQHLYAASDKGTVIIWEKPTKGFNKTPKFLPML